jgi:hypothetical protein
MHVIIVVVVVVVVVHVSLLNAIIHQLNPVSGIICPYSFSDTVKSKNEKQRKYVKHYCNKTN